MEGIGGLTMTSTPPSTSIDVSTKIKKTNEREHEREYERRRQQRPRRSSSKSKPTQQRGKQPRRCSKTMTSPVAVIDPAVRALNTIMFGMLVHFGTLWLIGGIGDHGKHENVDEHDTCITASHGEDDNNNNINSSSMRHNWIWTMLLWHEYWIYLQHCNVLANPLCQRLDRQYGIALLKSNQHWAIAGTLSAYWCRESLSMFLCLPFLQQQSTSERDTSTDHVTLTQYWILISLVYHAIKSRGVRRDALQRYSPTYGIMRVVIDKFYLHTYQEAVLTAGRLLLQGIDTWIHFSIVRDLLELGVALDASNSRTTTHISSLVTSCLHVIFGIWVVHAAINQYFRCSTATVMVQAWYSLTATTKNSSSNNKNGAMTTISSDNSIFNQPSTTSINSSDDEFVNKCNKDDNNTEVESASSIETDEDYDYSSSDEDEQFIVRRLLRPGRVATVFHGRQGVVTDGVDKAVRMETAMTIVATLFLIGLGTPPMRVLALPSHTWMLHSTQYFWQSTRRDESSLLSWSTRFTSFAKLSLLWWLSNLLHGFWMFFLRASNPRRVPDSCSNASRQRRNRALRRSILNMVDLTILIGSAIYIFPATGTEIETTRESFGSRICWYLGLCVTIKSFVHASTAVTDLSRSRLLSNFLVGIEFLGKLLLARKLLHVLHNMELQFDILPWIEALCSLGWILWVVSNPTPTHCEVISQRISEGNVESIAPDAVFLGHPAELIDCWALWLVPYSLSERWKRPVWAYPLWPIHYLVGWYVCNYRRKLFGDEASFFCCDDVTYEGIHIQTWTASHFGRHFITHPIQVKQNIEAAARYAERSGVKILCLGALNKAESINSGGVGVAKALGPNSKLSVIHGNHLTAAAVVETTVKCFGEKAKVFLTGASSKVGWAVAQALRDRHGYQVLCHSSDPGRRKIFRDHGFAAASTLSEGTHFSKLWIVGKYDLAVPHLIPQNATAVVFSVPHSLGSRLDVRVIEAGILHLDISRLDRPRQFSNKLCEREIFACHAASIVAASRLRRQSVSRILEIGPVDPLTMDTWLDDAKELGFRVPYVMPCESVDQEQSTPIVIVGAGPSGLAVAAALTRQNIPNILLESQDDPTQFGSWDQHFSNLEVTSQTKWCQLPNFPIHKCEEWKGEYITAQEYRRYLHLYASRFGLNISRGVEVLSIEKGCDPRKPWSVHIRTSPSINEGVSGVSKKTSLLATPAVVIATGKHRIAVRDTSDNLVERLEHTRVPIYHTTDLRDDVTWNRAIRAAQKGRLAIIGFGNSAADIATIVLQQCHKCPGTRGTAPRIHIAARTVPPVFPRQSSIFRVDTIGWFVRQFAFLRIGSWWSLEDLTVKLLWHILPSSRKCNSAFPPHLPRWKRIQGRVPVIDKYGMVASGFISGQLQGHGPVLQVLEGGNSSCPSSNADTDTETTTAMISFDDRPDHSQLQHNGFVDTHIPIEMVIMAIGYQKDNDDKLGGLASSREDRLNGLYHCGLGNDRLLPLQSIGEQALGIAHQITADFATHTS